MTEHGSISSAIHTAMKCGWWNAGSARALELTMTLTDPKIYTAPWVSEKKVFKLQPKEEIREEICVPSIEAEFNRRTRDPAAGITNK